MIGRIAFPLFAWVTAYHWVQRRDIGVAQMNRLFITALVAQLLWWSIPGVPIYSFNIFFTLLLARIAIIWLDEERYTTSIAQKWAALTILILFSFFVDYGPVGVAFVVACYATQRWPYTVHWIWPVTIVLILSSMHPHPYAWLAIPIGMAVLNLAPAIKRPYQFWLYYGYLLHLAVIATIANLV